MMEHDPEIHEGMMGDDGKAGTTTMAAEADSGVLTYKLQAMLVIFLIGMAGGLFPLKRISSQRFLSLGNAFSGGIFLSAAFVEMIAEAVEGFGRLNFETSFPVVMFFTVVGILIPFFIERVLADSHDHNALIQRETKSGASESQVGIYVLWLSLGVHSIIEGMAVGVEQHYSDVTGILVAIISHKFFSAFALGVSLVKAGIPAQRTIQLAASFACSTPSGILIGIFLTHTLSGLFGSILTEIMKSIAAGTFIYVALVEILLEEFGGAQGHSHSHSHHDVEDGGSLSASSDAAKKKAHGPSASKGLKFTFLLMGVAMMTAFSMLHSHDHGGAGHHEHDNHGHMD